MDHPELRKIVDGFIANFIKRFRLKIHDENLQEEFQRWIAEA